MIQFTHEASSPTNGKVNINLGVFGKHTIPSVTPYQYKIAKVIATIAALIFTAHMSVPYTIAGGIFALSTKVLTPSEADGHLSDISNSTQKMLGVLALAYLYPGLFAFASVSLLISNSSIHNGKKSDSLE